MKKIILFIAVLTSITVFAQNVGIGINTPSAKLHIKGSADTSQLIIDANATQSNTRPLIRMRNSSGTDLMHIHSDDSTNVFVGFKTGRVNNTAGGYGLYNSFIGCHAGYSNTTGYSNTAIGFYALNSNTAGNLNTANGHQALYSNTGDYNTANGAFALNFNTTGSSNTATGFSALGSNTSGVNNTANGYAALYSNIMGDRNTANGYLALYSNNYGYSNTANGYQALYSNTSGYSNVANGWQALYNNTSGFYNDAYGFLSLGSNTTGYHNAAFGYFALFNNIDGNNNTAIGSNAGVSAGNLFNATALGADAVANASNKIVIGSSSVGIVIGGYANWSNFSDGRFKENIREDVPGLSFINKLKPVTYQINSRELVNHITHLMPDSIASRYKKTEAEYVLIQQKRFTGFVAQDVEKAAKELGFDFDGVNPPRNETDHYSISYASFVIPLVKAVQEQQQQIELLKKQNEILLKRLETLENKNK